MAEQTTKRSTTTDNETLKTNVNPKKKKLIRRSDEGKQAKKQSDRQRGKTRVTIGVALPRWRALKKDRGLRADTDVAVFLLDWFSTSQTDGIVDKAVPCKRKSSSSVRPQDEQTTPGLLNDDVWVNLSCLLQLFQECGRCRAVCTVNTQEDTSHFSVVQYCKACNHWVVWNSQPLKSTSTEHAEKKEDVQVPTSSPCDDRRGRRKATDSESETWNEEEHVVELEVNIESDVSDEFPSCKSEEQEDAGESGGEGELGEESDEARESDDGQTERHHTDAEETEEQIAGSVGRTVEVKEEEDKGVTEDDERKDAEEEEDWSQEEQREGDSQASDPGFEMSKPAKRRAECPGTEDEDWQVGEEDDWSAEEEEEERGSQDESDSDFETSKPVKKYFVRRPAQRLCPNCGIMYATETHKCGDKRRFPCPKCGKLCVSEQNLNAHRIHCERSVFTCRFCLEPFDSKLDKVNHENGHKDTKLYLCSKCPEKFCDFRARNRHLKEHKVFTCRICQKQFQILHHLQRHELSHLDDKPFKCQVCERAFAQSSQLKCHMRVHTGERPYKCQLCPLAFNHNISLKTHIRRYHQNESHPVGPQSHPDSEQQRVTPRGPSSASDPREQGESAYIPSSDERLDSCQEPQPSTGSTEPEVHSMTVAESALENQGGLTFQTQLDIAEGEGGGNACDSRPKRKRPRNRWRDSDFEWEG